MLGAGAFFGRQPSPGAELVSRAEAAHIPDLSYHHGGGDEADTGDGEQAPYPGIVGEERGELALGQLDLAGDAVDQAQVSLHAMLRYLGQHHLAELDSTLLTEGIALRGRDRARPGRHGLDT